MYAGLRLGRISGIEVVADVSLLIIFMLVTFSLALGVFPSWHPQWGPALSWATAFGAALLFFTSVLVHELAHALVGRRGGVDVRRITLFMFGGMAHTESEPPSWKVELLMALAGPLVSILIGVVCLMLAQVGLDGVEVVNEDQMREFFAGLSPGATILLWLGWINIVLGIFNLVPGFPLDGGRVLRALVWAATGNLRRATRVASLLGQAFAWMLIAIGFAIIMGVSVPFFGRGFANGLWLVLIGWFLNNAALMSYRQLLITDALERVPVSRLMRVPPIRLDPDTSVSTFADRYALASGQDTFPVERDGRLLGLVTLKDVNKIGRDAWDAATLSDIMKPLDRLVALSADQTANDALRKMAECGVDQLPVFENNRFVGVLTREDVLKWMALRMAWERSEERAGRESSRAAD